MTVADMPGITENDGAVVLPMSYDAANSLIDSSRRLQTVPLLTRQTLQYQHTPLMTTNSLQAKRKDEASATTTTPQPFYGPFSGTTQVSR